MSSLGKASVRAVKWSAISTAGRFALQLLAQVILARILGPANYGLFGIGMVVYTFGNFFSSFGFGRNLLQKLDICEFDIRFAFTWQVVTGGTATVAIFIAAPTLAEYFNEPRVLPVIQWLSLACLLSAAAAPANNLLQRDLNFKTIGIIQVGSYAVGYLLLGIPLALAGYEVFALVSAWLAQFAVTLVATYCARPHSLRPLLWFPGARHAINYGGTVFFTNIVNWLLANLDRVVIGRMMNAQAVGLYTVGYNLATMPNAFLLSALQTVFLASGARVRAEQSRLRESYQQVLATIFVVLLPAFVFLAVLAPQIIALLYGTGWEQSGTVLSALFLGMPAFIIWGLSTPVLWNSGREKHESLLQIPILAAGAWALFAFADRGLAIVSWVTVAILVMRAQAIAGSAMAALDISPIQLLPDFLRGLALSAVGASVAYAGIHVTERFALPLATLSLSGIAAACVAIGMAWFQPGLLGHRTCAMLVRFLPWLGTR